VAEALRRNLATQPRARVVFAAAPSQDAMLAELRAAVGIDWARVTAFHMDEYVGLDACAPQLFATYLRTHLFDVVGPGEVHLLDPANGLAQEADRYTRLLSHAPIDIVCLGIGENGHLAFNDPPVADFEDPQVVKLVELDEDCRRQQVNDGCFPRLDDVPRRALTLTIPALLSARIAFVVVPGKTKASAVNNALTGPIDERCPASALRRHPDATLFIDPDSASLLPDSRHR
jgi:glucosamine-6-phosphate deaminase